MNSYTIASGTTINGTTAIEVLRSNGLSAVLINGAHVPEVTLEEAISNIEPDHQLLLEVNYGISIILYYQSPDDLRVHLYTERGGNSDGFGWYATV